MAGSEATRERTWEEKNAVSALEDAMSESSDLHSNPAQPGEPVGAMDKALERNVPRSRYVFVLAIVSTFVSSVVLLVLGLVETFRVVFEALGLGGHADANQVRLSFIETIDMFLLAASLYIIASGFYQLLGLPSAGLSSWMRVSSVEDLEHKLVGVLIVVLGVLGLSRVDSWDGQSNLLPFGITVALLIAALAYYETQARH
jgi:uncharacterized membrane protein YqhA